MVHVKKHTFFNLVMYCGLQACFGPKLLSGKSLFDHNHWNSAERLTPVRVSHKIHTYEFAIIWKALKICFKLKVCFTQLILDRKWLKFHIK